ncbi:efflux transporter periplasmic adaptor subunit [Roseivirga sp. 4D4]|nr:efflux transporter periplasmic adaptor subunit [Roseivirga sp. 4D4]
MCIGVPLFALSYCQRAEQSLSPEVTTLTESVYASITVQPEDLYNVHSSVGGIIKDVLVEEGDSVAYETPLIQIKSTNPEMNLRNAQLALDLAKRNYEGRANVLNEIRDEISIAQLKLENDSINFVKQRNLWNKNIGTQNTYETRELAYLTAKANLNLLNNRLLRTEQDLLTKWEEAQNNYRNAKSTQGDYTIKSRIEGRVYEVMKEPGEIVNVQEPLAVLGNAKQFIIEMEIDEVDITKIVLGQRTIISLDAYPDEVFNAFISQIYPRKNMATQTFKVEAKFLNPPTKLFSGLSGEANIITRVKEEALVIPRTYLTDKNEVKTEDGLVPVQTGLQSLDQVEILSGIDATTKIYLPKQ